MVNTEQPVDEMYLGLLRCWRMVGILVHQRIVSLSLKYI